MRVFWSFRPRKLVLALILVGLVAGCIGIVWESRVQDLAAMAHSVSGVVIVLDPGHGGKDPGAVGPSGQLEKHIVLAVARELSKILTEAGAIVYLTRDGDYDLAQLPGEPPPPSRKKVDLPRRVEVAVKNGAQLFITIHVNAIPSSRWRGAQVFYYDRGHPENQRLAKAVQAEVNSRLSGARQVKIIRDQYVLKEMAIPACNVEIGFISNPAEARDLCSPSYQRKVAWAVFMGIARYYMESALETCGR
ncbi:MAG: N-acetylmuramoyl-L-alanine amidase [Bacillota bacterium]